MYFSSNIIFNLSTQILSYCTRFFIVHTCSQLNSHTSFVNLSSLISTSKSLEFLLYIFSRLIKIDHHNFLFFVLFYYRIQNIVSIGLKFRLKIGCLKYWFYGRTHRHKSKLISCNKCFIYYYFPIPLFLDNFHILVYLFIL